MGDARVGNLARILTQYSIVVKSGMTVTIAAPSAAEALVAACYEELIKLGCYPVVNMAPAGLTEILFQHGQPHHFDRVTKFQRAAVKLADASIRIMAETNTRGLSKADPKKQAALSMATRPLSNIMLSKSWVLTLFPTAAYAQDAEMSLRDFEDFVYAATFATEDDPVKAWEAIRIGQDRLIKKLKGADEIHIVGPGTDLKLSVKGRTFINSAGTHNMPSGEIFTGPIEDSAEGVVQYDFPVCNAGREIDGIRLVFRKGLVVEASATKNEAFLKAMLDMDPGARRLGELGIGTNRNIQRFIKNILFDEKIGGTIHLALGKSYPETGGVNKSGLHWDMIKDLRKDGAIYVDGTLFEKNGKFV